MSFLKRRTSKGPSQGRKVKNECRHAWRYPVVMHDAILGWKEDGILVELPVYVEDISSLGCLVKSSCKPVPRPGESIWFKAPKVDSFHWVEGVLIAAGKPFLGECSIRIRFLAPLSYKLFKFLVQGPERTVSRPGPSPAFETDQFWK